MSANNTHKEVTDESDTDHDPLSTRGMSKAIRHAFMASSTQVLSYRNVDPGIGYSLAKALDEDANVEEIAPRIGYNSVTRVIRIELRRVLVHDTPQAWMNHEMVKMATAGFLSLDELEGLQISSGTSFVRFQSPYSASFKQPDWSIRPLSHTLPTLVVESGWNDSLGQLQKDMELWLVGGRRNVQVVLVFVWTELPHGCVEGLVQVYNADTTGNPKALQEKIIFPTPDSASSHQTITLTLGQIFGEALPADRSSNETFDLSLDGLRRKATADLTLTGLTPA